MLAYTGKWYLAALSLIASFVFLVLLGRLGKSEGSLIFVLEKFYYSPYMMVTVDNRIVHVMSGWDRVVFLNANDFSFETIDLGLSKGLTAGKVGSKTRTTIFAYHQFLRPFIMEDSDLVRLTERLNILAQRARAMPDMKYEEISE